eukprot:1532591-Amphidinium_carterae.1
MKARNTTDEIRAKRAHTRTKSGQRDAQRPKTRTTRGTDSTHQGRTRRLTTKIPSGIHCEVKWSS